MFILTHRVEQSWKKKKEKIKACARELNNTQFSSAFYPSSTCEKKNGRIQFLQV